MAQQSTNKRPQDGEQRYVMSKYLKALLIVCTISVSSTILLQFKLFGIDFSHGPSIGVSTIINSVFSRPENDDAYSVWRPDDGDAIEKYNETPVPTGDKSDKATIDTNEKNDIDEEDQIDGDNAGKIIDIEDQIDGNNVGKIIGKEDQIKSESQKTFESNKERLNIVLLYPDDWRHDSIGSEKPYVLTPVLNQLANEGIRFTQNAVTTSVCWMSRATMWMGQYSSRHQSYRLKCPMFTKEENWKHSWVSMLKDAGYFLGHIGKWQYHGKPNRTNSFDYEKIFEGHHWYPIFGKTTKIHGSDKARDHAIEFIKKVPNDKPFALSVAFYPPKPVSDNKLPGKQWEPTNETRVLYDNVTIPEPETMGMFNHLPEFLQKTKPSRRRFRDRYGTPEHFQASMKNYYASITGVDKACGEIIEFLKEKGLHNNTMIIFTTDNGMFHGSHGLAGKWYPYQESIRVPLIIYDPRMPPEKVGTLDDSFTLNIDLAETILGAAGLRPNDFMQGRDISDLYLPNQKDGFHSTASVKSEPWRDDFFYEFPESEKFIPASTALVNKEWKYIHWTYQNYEQLFHLRDDPLEMNDLYNNTDVQSVLESMRKRHDELKGMLHNETYAEHPCLKDESFNYLKDKV